MKFFWRKKQKPNVPHWQPHPHGWYEDYILKDVDGKELTRILSDWAGSPKYTCLFPLDIPISGDDLDDVKRRAEKHFNITV